MNRLFITLTALLLCLPAMAAEKGASGTDEVGRQTREALQLQRSGQAASTTQRPLSGEVAERVNQRHVESFSHPIPESFSDKEQEFVKGSE